MKSVEARKTYERPALRKLTLSHAKAIFLNHARELLELILPGRTAKDDTEPAMMQKQYEKPALKKFTPEQAKLLLIGHASMGDQGAKDILGLLFPEASDASLTENTQDVRRENLGGPAL